ncbi:hypothetical protein TWF281_000218 [Arthrobotrys megalospora]
MTDLTRDHEAERRRFLTECQILANLHTDTSHNLRRQQLFELREWMKPLRNNIANNLALNRLLDNLAFLLVSKPKRDCIAVALVGLTRDKIELVARTSNKEGGEDGANLESIQNHAQEMFKLVQKYSVTDPTHSDPYRIFEELAVLQIGYSASKLWARVSLMRKFTDKVRGFQLPTWVNPELKEPRMRDKFYIPSVTGPDGKDLGTLVHRQLIQVFRERGNLRNIMPPEDKMLVLNRENFDSWTELFLWFLEKVRTVVRKLVKREVDGNTQVPIILSHLEAMQILVAQSQLFRTWVEVITRTLDGGWEQDGRKKQGELPTLEELVEPGFMREETVVAGPSGMTEAEPLAMKLRRRDKFKATLRGALPAFVTNRLTPKPRRSKDPVAHIKNLFPRPSEPAPGNGESRDDDAALGVQEGEGLSHQSSFLNESILEEDLAEAGFENEAEIITAQEQSADFNILRLVPQHLAAIESILDSSMVLKLARTREFSLEVLPSDEEEPISLPCESLRETLSHILTATGSPEVELGEKVKQFLEHAEAHIGEPSGSRRLLALDTENPTLRVSGHAELLLLSYCQQLERKGEYPYRYIGVSKPPCLVCEVVLLNHKDFPMATQEGHTHIYVSSIPAGISRAHQSEVFDFVGRLAEGICREFYVRKRRDSGDSYHVAKDGTPGGRAAPMEKVLNLDNLR